MDKPAKRNPLIERLGRHDMLLTSVRAYEELEAAAHQFLHPCVIEVFHALINEVQVHAKPLRQGFRG